MYSLKLGTDWLQNNLTTFGPASFSVNYSATDTYEVERGEELYDLRAAHPGSHILTSPRPH